MQTLKSSAFATSLMSSMLTVTACLLGMAVTAVPVTAAAQGITLINCVGSHTASWTPGLTNDAQVVTVATSSQWDCPLLETSATSMQRFPQNLSCNSLLQPTTVEWVITWANNQTSTAQLSGNIVEINGNLVIPLVGTITAGLYANDNVAITITDTSLAGTLQDACTSPGGLTGASGPTSLTISGL